MGYPNKNKVLSNNKKLVLFAICDLSLMALSALPKIQKLNSLLRTSKIPIRSLSSSSIKMISNEGGGPISQSIECKLKNAFGPLVHLDIINESYMHNVPKGSETHFKVVVVSEKFNDMKPLIKRHRAVNEILAEELQTGVHALSIVAKSPAQWNPDSTID